MVAYYRGILSEEGEYVDEKFAFVRYVLVTSVCAESEPTPSTAISIAKSLFSFFIFVEY